MRKKMRNLAIVVFGVLFPVVVLTQAYLGITSLRENVAYTKTVGDLVGDMSELKKNISSANDYALFSLLYVEHANQKTMINKQVMKSAIVNIGFAVISVGIMLIILGIQAKGDGGLEADGEAGGLKFEFRTGSTGVAVFVIGALMATMGGVLRNEYKTSEIPRFETTRVATGISQYDARYEKSLNAYRACKSRGKSSETCFAQNFLSINKDRLK